MKFTLNTLLACFFLFGSLQAQDETSKKRLLDFRLDTCEEAYAHYYEIISLSPDSNGHYESSIYYRTEEVLYSKGQYEDLDSLGKTGNWTHWHANGQKKETGSYVNDLKEGRWEGWHDNGAVDYIEQYAGGKLEGQSEYFFENGQRSARVTYAAGEMTEEVYWEPDGSALEDISIANRKPEYPGGDIELYTFIGTNMKYPAAARKRKEMGRVYVAFVVGRNGMIQEAQVVKSVSPDLDKEALRVINMVPQWQEGRIMNRPVAVRMVFPITFKLQ